MSAVFTLSDRSSETICMSLGRLFQQPYWQLSCFYFVYFGSLGIIVPYWPLYLDHLGFSASQIGQLMAITMITRVVAPNLWGWLIDRTGKTAFWVRQGSLWSLITFAGIFINQSLAWVVVVMVLFSFFWSTVLPPVELLTLRYLGNKGHRYSQIRLWGSVGFVITSVAAASVLDGNRALLPVLVFAAFVLIWLFSLTLDDIAPSTAEQSSNGSVKTTTRPLVIWLFFFMCFLMQLSHGPYYTFYSIHLESAGYSAIAIGQLWALGVVIEVLIFILMPRLLRYVSLSSVFVFSLLLATLRWWIIGDQVDSLGWLLFAQTLHAATFGTFHAAAVLLVFQFFKQGQQGRGQALYSSLSFGAGGALGSVASGWMWETFSPSTTFLSATAAAALGFLIGLAWLKLASETE